MNNSKKFLKTFPSRKVLYMTLFKYTKKFLCDAANIMGIYFIFTGNSFLTSIFLADLLATSVMLPASSVAILSQMENSENLCRFQYAVGAMSCVTAAVFTAVVGVENFLRLSTLQQAEKQRRHRQQQQQQQHHQHPHHPHQQSHGSSISSSTATAAATTSTSTTTPRAITVQLVPERHSNPYRCSQFQVTVLNLTLWVFSGSLVLLHVLMMPQSMYAACGFFDERGLDRESLVHSLLVFTICFTSFIVVGGLGFLKCVCIMKSWDRPKPYLISREFALVSSNCWNWLARFLIWCPSLLIAILSSHSQDSSLLPMSSDSTLVSSATTSTAAEAVLHLGSSSYSSSISNFGNIISSTVSPLLLLGNPTNSLASVGSGAYNSSRIAPSELISLQGLLLWPAILPPCLSSLINAISNRDFRRCYIQLFHYCCCKTSVALTRRSRDNLRGGSDVRVHIIPGYNIYTSSTGHCSEVTTTPPRFNTFKYGSLMACRRDVYEL